MIDEKTGRQIEFRNAWLAAQELDRILAKHKVSLEFAVLVSSMIGAAEATAEIANDSTQDDAAADSNHIFEFASSMLEDSFSVANLRWFMENYPEMKKFGVKRTVSYEPEFPVEGDWRK